MNLSSKYMNISHITNAKREKLRFGCKIDFSIKKQLFS